MNTAQSFFVVTAEAVTVALEQASTSLVPLVRATYQAFGAGLTVNPRSSFLRPTSAHGQSNRIIALPAFLGGEFPVAGIKWVSSFPGNLDIGLPRAFATLVLNDATTGQPFACLEGSLISAARTAASAVLGASLIGAGSRDKHRIGFIGTGVIARAIWRCFMAELWQFGRVHVFDTVASRAQAFGDWAATQTAASVLVSQSLEELLRDTDLLVFATTASKPYIVDPQLIPATARILHISLRDLGPGIILAAQNVVDDIEHCLREQTSPHLAEQALGSRNFDIRNVYDCLGLDGESTWTANGSRPVVFSPFGLGVLDIAVGIHVFRHALRAKHLIRIDNFFPTAAL